MHAANTPTQAPIDPLDAAFLTTALEHDLSRRGLLRAGGITVALAALLAACGESSVTDKNPARVGTASTVAKLPDGVVNDGVLFRTATSIHYSIIDGHNIAKQLGKLTADQTKIVDDYIAANKAAIKDLQSLTSTAGGKGWTCANPRFDRVILTPIKDRITGRPKTGAEEGDVSPSDDPNRDAMALVWALESLAAEMHQNFVPQLSQPKYRASIIVHGDAAARRSAAISMVINPENLVTPTTLANANISVTTTTVAATTTTSQNLAGAPTTTAAIPAAPAGSVQQYYAIPSQFGTLSAVQLGVGAFPSGTQFNINIETPSLNSFIYDYMTDC